MKKVAQHVRHKTNTTGQLRPLKERMSLTKQLTRAPKQEARHTMAVQISREHAITRGIAVAAASVLRRGFFGRLKWLLLGR